MTSLNPTNLHRPNVTTWAEEELQERRDKSLERTLHTYRLSDGEVMADGKVMLNLSSNDYLDLARHPAVIASAAEALHTYGAGAGASRLVTGTLPIHEELEKRLADYKGYDCALTFGSGYMANAGTVSSLVRRGDVVFADALSHASLLDAVTLSRAKLLRFRHNDMLHLEELLKQNAGSTRRLVITESVFSMDGDLAPLSELAALATAHEAMIMVDEAHATGVFGPSGAGLLAAGHLQDRVHIGMGTMSKALGGYGGFVALDQTLRQLIVNKGRSFIYTTAMPPPVAGAALGALNVLKETPDMGKTLLTRANRFRNQLQDAGLNTLHSESQIIPVLVGDAAKACALSQRLRDKGLLAIAMRPPTVPEGTARLRLSLSLAHTNEQLEQAAIQIIDAAKQEGVLT